MVGKNMGNTSSNNRNDNGLNDSIQKLREEFNSLKGTFDRFSDMLCKNIEVQNQGSKRKQPPTEYHDIHQPKRLHEDSITPVRQHNRMENDEDCGLPEEKKEEHPPLPSDPPKEEEGEKEKKEEDPPLPSDSTREEEEEEEKKEEDPPLPSDSTREEEEEEEKKEEDPPLPSDSTREEEEEEEKKEEGPPLPSDSTREERRRKRKKRRQAWHHHGGHLLKKVEPVACGRLEGF
ncbi:hypothetical protein DUNSADRAFT_14003 [Dunaliella salina]|uniref:Uncharacterized protein n=1 Tax=Dunaliella salina TaxID=3046 RepID=A0ABQ7H2T6_DUNSA|nr:hypothetical protein DUNSADRAFT_14003 [Dunaliella salina]|eukprot:KAF5841173.1 hypothetical protein DUNSADRAFT_14003 [Dunaliella salina]